MAKTESTETSDLTLEQLLDAGAHFGHTRGRWHPAMKPYIYMTRERIHILNLEKTLEKMKDLTNAVENFVAAGKTLVLVGTKRQAKAVVEEIAKELNIPYVSERWLGGTLTNFETVRGTITTMNKLTEQMAGPDETTGLKKRERRRQAQELERMETKFGGLKMMNKIPDGLFIIDPSYEQNAILEARRLGLTIFAMLDTSSNPGLVDEFVPANDDAARSIRVVMAPVKEAISRGQKRAQESAKVVNDEAMAKAEAAVAAANKQDK